MNITAGLCCEGGNAAAAAAGKGKSGWRVLSTSRHSKASLDTPKYNPTAQGGSSLLCLSCWASVKIKGFEWSHMWVFSLPRHVIPL